MSSGNENVQRALSRLTSFAVIRDAILEDDSPHTWTTQIRVPAFDAEDVPVLLAFMHTDEPQCAM